MTAENNRKYIAEAWIDDGTEEEMKKSFLKSLIEQMQGHLNGFDSDTVDGMHWEEVDGDDGIKDYIDKKVVSLLSSFKIGITLFSGDKEDGQYYLGFDAIKLFDFDYYDEYDESNKKLPWTNVFTEESTVPTLLEVINELYELTIIKGDDDSPFSSNKEFYESLVETLTNMEEMYNLISPKIDKTQGTLNADTINGLRFFIYSEEQYEELKTLASQYDSNGENTPEIEGAHKKITSINNIFIIRTEQEIIDAGFKDGIYAGNPDILNFSYIYEFRVYVPEEGSEEETTLQYRHQGTEEWMDIAKAKDFIDPKAIAEAVIEQISNNTSYTLNSVPFNKAIAPFIETLRTKYIQGAFYKDETGAKKDIDVEKRYINSSDTIGDRYLDLTEFQEWIETKISNAISAVNPTIETINTNINNIKSRLTTVEASLSNVSNKSTTLESEINTLKNRVGTLERKTSWTTYINNSSCQVYYNDYSVLIQVHIGANANRPRTYDVATINDASVRPKHSIAAPMFSIGSWGDPYGFIKVNGNDGKITLTLNKDVYNENQAAKPKRSSLDLWGSITYPRRF